MLRNPGSYRHFNRLLLSLAGLCFAYVGVASGLLPDPSVLIDAIILGSDGDLPFGLDPEHANVNAFEGGATGTNEDTFENINESNLQNNGEIDVPTGAKPSPLFGAVPFSQRMLRFEEFGPVPLGSESSVVAGDPLPAPADAVSVPDEVALDDFLDQYISVTEALPFPFPIREANCFDLSPWQSAIETFLGRTLDDPPAEGRPPGEN